MKEESVFWLGGKPGTQKAAEAPPEAPETRAGHLRRVPRAWSRAGGFRSGAGRLRQLARPFFAGQRPPADRLERAGRASWCCRPPIRSGGWDGPARLPGDQRRSGRLRRRYRDAAAGRFQRPATEPCLAPKICAASLRCSPPWRHLPAWIRCSRSSLVTTRRCRSARCAAPLLCLSWCFPLPCSGVGVNCARCG